MKQSHQQVNIPWGYLFEQNYVRRGMIHKDDKNNEPVIISSNTESICFETYFLYFVHW